MIDKSIIDLLSDDIEIQIPANKKLTKIDETFVKRSESQEQDNSNAELSLSTKKKLQILSWNYMDMQLRSYGHSKLNKIIMELIDEEDRKHVINTGNDFEFDFKSDSIPFASKFNVAMAISCAEAIEILSNMESCEIYASEEVKKVFEKYHLPIAPGLNKINFKELPIEMKKELIWPMTQNLLRAITVKRAAQIFPEGIPGKIACEALMSECKDADLSADLSKFEGLKYSDYETVFFSDLSDLEIKYHIASYCIEHVNYIKKKEPEQQEKEVKKEELKSEENLKSIENEYIEAFKRINKDKSFWDKISFENILKMGKDVLSAIQEEIRDFSRLKSEIIYRLSGKSTVAIENDELIRIAKGRNPNFEVASRYMDMFIQPSDYYSILGIDKRKKVTEKEVKDAFKKLAKIYHPDKNPNDPYREEKERRFKQLIEAKEAIIKQLRAGKEDVSEFREDIAIVNYLGRISKLFSDNIQQSQANPSDNMNDVIVPQKGMDNASEQECKSYLGPYLDEIRALEAEIGSWEDKHVLVIGAGRKPEDFSTPVIIAKLGAIVHAIDVDYVGPEEYKGCRYYRLSVDRVDLFFKEETFDIILSTALFGVPLTNWAIRYYSLNPFSPTFENKMKEFELEILGKLFRLTKVNGVHLHYNKDMNPQSWNFGEADLKRIGFKYAYHPKGLQNPNSVWILKK